MASATTPVPPFFDPKIVGDLRMIQYGALAEAASTYAKKYNIKPFNQDKLRVCVMPIDMQGTFCYENGELPVIGALDDCNRFATMVYKNLGVITKITPTLDTHRVYQIFHPAFWVDQNGNHPAPFTVITEEDQASGKWQVNPAVAATVMNGDYAYLRNHCPHYSKTLKKTDKDALIIWPYHGMLGGIGHALVPNVEEAIFFHSIARKVLMGVQIKGGNLITENYAVTGPEVLTGYNGQPIAQKNVAFIGELLENDRVVITGEAMDKCVAWSIDGLLKDIKAKDPKLAAKVYIVRDCTSPVKVPNPKGGFFVDGTAAGEKAFKDFEDAGMHIVNSTVPMMDWPDFAA